MRHGGENRSDRCFPCLIRAFRRSFDSGNRQLSSLCQFGSVFLRKTAFEPYTAGLAQLNISSADKTCALFFALCSSLCSSFSVGKSADTVTKRPFIRRYYFANRTNDTPWVMLPIESFDAYYGNTNFSRKWMSKLPKEIITREYHRDVSRILLNS